MNRRMNITPAMVEIKPAEMEAAPKEGPTT
jgi:hypothetical protein